MKEDLMRRNNHFHIALDVGFLLVGNLAVAFGQPTLQVQVFQAGTMSPVYYQYRVVNNSGKSIVRVIVGRGDYYNGRSELLTAPLNWNFDIGVNPGSLTQPSAWGGNYVTRV